MRVWVVLALVLGFAGSVEACGGSPRRGNVRRCFANQKTVAGALEMWNLDKNCRVDEHLARGEDPLQYLENPATGRGECRFKHTRPVDGASRAFAMPPQLWDALKSNGYLSWIPTDPGQGNDSRENYILTTFGTGVMCLYHGDIGGNGASPARRRLQLLGVRDTALLARASTEDPMARRVSDDPLLVLAMCTVGFAFLWTLGRMFARADETAAERFGRACSWGAFLVLAFVPLAIAGLEWCAVVGTAWQVGAAAGAIVVGGVRVLFGIAVIARDASEPEAERAPERPAARRPQHPLPLLMPKGLKCAVCGCADGPALWVTCPACDAAHHGECWSFQDGCAAFGCSMAHGRWKSAGALPERTETPSEGKHAIRWIE